MGDGTNNIYEPRNHSDTILLVVDAEKPTARLARRSVEIVKGRVGRVLTVLLFVDAESSWIEKLSRELSATFQGEVVIREGSKNLIEASSTAERELTQFAVSLPDRLQTIVSPRFAQMLDDNWAFTDISEKNALALPQWYAAIRAIIIEKHLSQNDYHDVTVVGTRLTGNAIRSYCESRQIEFRADLDSPVWTLRRMLLHRARSFVSRLSVAIAAKILTRKYSKTDKNRSAESRRYLIHSGFPSMWEHAEQSSPRDRYYADLFKHLDRSDQTEPIYVLRTIYRFFYTSPLNAIRGILHSKKIAKHSSSTVFERYTSIWSLIKLFLSPISTVLLVKLLMARGDDSLGSVSRLRHLDLSDLVKDLLVRSVVSQWPICQSIEQTSKALTDSMKPAASVSYLYEFSYGQAIIRGLNRAIHQSPIMAVQHGPISPLKMLYSGTKDEYEGAHAKSLADRYIVDGDAPKSVLSSNGIPSERITATGAPRQTPVWSKVNTVTAKDDSQSKTVLVTPGLHDFTYVANRAIQALKNTPKIKIKIKAHPKTSSTEIDNLETMIGNASFGNISVVSSGDLYDTFREGDLVLATYSTTGIEALAFELPVVLILSNYLPDSSLFWEVSEHVFRAGSAEELRRHTTTCLEMSQAERSEYLKQIKPALDRSFKNRSIDTSAELARHLTELGRS